MKQFFATACAILLTLTLITSATPLCALDLLGVMTAGSYENTELYDAPLPYRIYVPTPSSENGAETEMIYGILVYLHDEDCRGDDNVAHISDTSKTAIIGAFLNDAEVSRSYIVVAPQCPKGTTWSNGDGELLALVCDLLKNDIMQKYTVDKERILVTGISMGASAAYDLLSAQNEEGTITFSGAYLVGGEASDTSALDAYAKTAVYAFVSDSDTVTPPDSVVALGNAMQTDHAGRMFVTEYPDLGHEIWSQAYGEDILKTGFMSIGVQKEPADTAAPIETNPPASEEITTEEVADTTDAPESEPPSVVTTPGLAIPAALIAYVIMGCACILAVILLIMGLLKNNRAR